MDNFKRMLILAKIYCARRGAQEFLADFYTEDMDKAEQFINDLKAIGVQFGPVPED